MQLGCKKGEICNFHAALFVIKIQCAIFMPIPFRCHCSRCTCRFNCVPLVHYFLALELCDACMYVVRQDRKKTYINVVNRARSLLGLTIYCVHAWWWCIYIYVKTKEITRRTLQFAANLICICARESSKNANCTVAKYMKMRDKYLLAFNDDWLAASQVLQEKIRKTLDMYADSGWVYVYTIAWTICLRRGPEKASRRFVK